MKYLDEYRDPQAARQLLSAIQRRATRRWTIMEVCGGQTHGLLRHGIEAELADTIELIHGPGCPVCVTPLEALDLAADLALRHDVVVATFGDMLRVPGSRGSLFQLRARGANLRVVYSPLDAVRLAEECPDRTVVFLAVGFETTAPATALAIKQADQLGLRNFCLLVAHVRVLPAMEAIVSAQETRVDGFLAAGHVCTITGYETYRPFVARHRRPVVVTGFEPVDLLAGILACVEQLERGENQVCNQYGRSVRPEGNREAQALVDDVFEICDVPWRGLGEIYQGGFRLRDAYEQFDARRRFSTLSLRVVEPTTCRSGEVLAGRIKPPDCAEFGRGCSPEHPLGAPMVSTEGACAAYYRYSSWGSAPNQALQP